jgi:predicted NAD-dependent protein-ADP-ribosyltransferase YbiA (DUF1768 family)
MSDDEEVSAVLTGEYRQFVTGNPVVLFKADKAIPICYLSNLTVAHVKYDGITYPSAEHGFQAQKFHPSVRHLFSSTGVFGDPTNNFQRGWTAYFDAKTPRGDNITKVLQKMKYYAKKNTFGVLAKMVNNLSRKPGKMELLGLRPNLEWDFNDAHESFWLEILRSKFTNPTMRSALLGTGDAYLIEYQKFEKKKGTSVDHVDFYTAYYNESTGECVHCNEPGCNAIGKFLMKIRDEGSKRKALELPRRPYSRRGRKWPTGTDIEDSTDDESEWL